MSTHQQVKPRCANQSITEESGRPRTVRSKVGSEAIDEPCTNSTAGLPSGEPANFSHRNRRTSPESVFLWVQCSLPVMVLLLNLVPACCALRYSLRGGPVAHGVREGRGSVEFGAGFLDHLGPVVAFGAKERAELGRRRTERLDRRVRHVALDLVA